MTRGESHSGIAGRWFFQWQGGQHDGCIPAFLHSCIPAFLIRCVVAVMLFSIGGVASAQGSVHFRTTVNGETSHDYYLDNFGQGGANRSGTGTLDTGDSIEWSTDGDGNLTITLNGSTIAQLAEGGNKGSGIGSEGSTPVEWINLDYEAPLQGSPPHGLGQSLSSRSDERSVLDARRS